MVLRSSMLRLNILNSSFNTAIHRSGMCICMCRLIHTYFIFVFPLIRVYIGMRMRIRLYLHFVSRRATTNITTNRDTKTNIISSPSLPVLPNKMDSGSLWPSRGLPTLQTFGLSPAPVELFSSRPPHEPSPQL